MKRYAGPFKDDLEYMEFRIKQDRGELSLILRPYDDLPELGFIHDIIISEDTLTCGLKNDRFL